MYPDDDDAPEEIVQFIRDVVATAGATRIVIGVSGGVDSAVCLHLCARAVGPRNVMPIHLPMQNTPEADTRHAHEECSRLRARLTVRPIQTIVNGIIGKVATPNDNGHRLIRGNAAARVRMVILYALANRYNGIVCGTGNRTEYFIGYTTKWGDNAADFYPILHLLKTEVWELAGTLGVGQEIIDKPPSAGLWEGQTDEGDIGMSYREIDREIVEFLNGDGPIEDSLMSLHLWNRHKSEPGPSLLTSRW